MFQKLIKKQTETTKNYILNNYYGAKLYNFHQHSRKLIIN